MKKNSSMPSPGRGSTIYEGSQDVYIHKQDRAVRPGHGHDRALENKPAAVQQQHNNDNNKFESKPSMDINESAEAFIKKFRQQLLIQRLESIENYEKMLARGL